MIGGEGLDIVPILWEEGLLLDGEQTHYFKQGLQLHVGSNLDISVPQIKDLSTRAIEVALIGGEEATIMFTGEVDFGCFFLRVFLSFLLKGTEARDITGASP